MVKRPPVPGLTGPEEFYDDRQFSVSLSRGLQLLRAFRPGDPPLGNRELCERTGLPKATVSRLAYTLMVLGYLSRSANNRYVLGVGVLTLAYPLLAGMRIRQIARPWLDRLARTTRGTANLAMREGVGAVYVESFSMDRGNKWRPDIGDQVPLLSTAIGCALLVSSPSDEQSAVLNRLRVHDPARFAREFPIWERERDAFARVGYCSSYGEWRSGVHGVAIPLRQEIQSAVMAINCTRKVHPGDAAQFASEASDALLQTAREIELACAREHGGRTPWRGLGIALSAREREVFERLAAGMANHQIADALGLSPKTISTHKRNLMRRLRVDNLAELIRAADLLR